MSNWPRCAIASRPSARQRRDRFAKPLGDYSEAEALQVIDAIVTCWSDAMVAHHEASKLPARAGLPPTPDPWHPMPPIRSPIWRTTCLGRTEGGSHDGLQFLIEHLGPGHRLVDAGMQQACARQSERQYLGARRASAWPASARCSSSTPRLRSTTGATPGPDAAHLRAWPRHGGLHGRVLRDAGFDLRTRKPDGEQFGFSGGRWSPAGPRRRRDRRRARRVSPIPRSGRTSAWAKSGAIWRRKASPSPSRSTPRRWRSTRPISNCTSTRRCSRRSTPTRWRSTPSSCPLTARCPAHVGSGGQGHHGDRGRRTAAAARLPRPDPLRMPDVRVARPLLEDNGMSNDTQFIGGVEPIDRRQAGALMFNLPYYWFADPQMRSVQDSALPMGGLVRYRLSGTVCGAAASPRRGPGDGRPDASTSTTSRHRPIPTVHLSDAEREAIRAELLARLESVLPRLFPAGKKRGGKFLIGDVLGSPGDSPRWCSMATRRAVDGSRHRRRRRHLLCADRRAPRHRRAADFPACSTPLPICSDARVPHRYARPAKDVPVDDSARPPRSGTTSTPPASDRRRLPLRPARAEEEFRPGMPSGARWHRPIRARSTTSRG